MDYDPLPANADPEKAMTEGVEVLWPQNEGGNLAFHTELGEDDGLAEAAHVAEVRMESQRLAAVPMEPNGILVEPGTPDGGMTVIFPSQAPIGLKDGFCRPVRPRRRQRAADRSCGGRRFRSQDRPVSRVPGGGQGRLGTGPPCEVDRVAI